LDDLDVHPTQQFDLPMPPAVVRQRLENSPKQMAFKISAISPGEEAGSFNCFITYANACARLQAKSHADGKSTRVIVETRSMTLWTRPAGMILTIAILFVGTIVDQIVFQAKSLADWCLFPGTLLVWIGINLALIPLSKRVLSQSIHDILAGVSKPAS
jgi:hypothetical protein